MLRRLLTTTIRRPPSFDRRTVEPCANTGVEGERVAFRFVPELLASFVQVRHAHSHKRPVIGRIMARPERAEHVPQQTTLFLDFAYVTGCSIGGLAILTGSATDVLFEAVREVFDILFPPYIAFDVSKVVRTVRVKKTAQTHQLMLLRVLIAIRNFDNDILYTVPQNVDVILRFHQNITTAL